MKKSIIWIAVCWLVILAVLSVIFILLYPINVIIGGFKEHFRAGVLLLLLAAYVTVLYYKSVSKKDKETE
jgi:hypothetical protein